MNKLCVKEKKNLNQILKSILIFYLTYSWRMCSASRHLTSSVGKQTISFGTARLLC